MAILYETPPGYIRKPDDIDGWIEEVADELTAMGIDLTKPWQQAVDEALARDGLGPLAAPIEPPAD